jgi:hypothetical protein
LSSEVRRERLKMKQLPMRRLLNLEPVGDRR